MDYWINALAAIAVAWPFGLVAMVHQFTKA